MMKRKKPITPKARPKPQRRRPQPVWLTTWRRLLHRSTFASLEELLTFLEGEGLHNGEVPSPEAMRRGIAKVQRGKYYWHRARCTRVLQQHGKYEEVNKDDYELED